MKKYNIVALGECLIDCIPEGLNENGVPLFSANPGGAPANVLAMASRLGSKTAFIGKVGLDGYGKLLKQNLVTADIDTVGLIEDSNYNTTLAMVHLDKKGDRSFSFYRDGCADVMLAAKEVPVSLLTDCSFFHFGSVSLTNDPVRTATIRSAVKAKQNGAIISYDPNYRPLLWKSEEIAVSEMKKGLALADIIKVSEEEMMLLTGETELKRGAEVLYKNGVSLIFITLGKKGAFYYNKNSNGLIPTYNVKTVDTTGAGDSFLGAVLWCLKAKTKKEITDLSEKELQKIVKFGNAAGSLATTKKGAIPAMPTLSEINRLAEDFKNGKN